MLCQLTKASGSRFGILLPAAWMVKPLRMLDWPVVVPLPPPPSALTPPSTPLEAEEAEKPVLPIQDWALHGRIDRVDEGDGVTDFLQPRIAAERFELSAEFRDDLLETFGIEDADRFVAAVSQIAGRRLTFAELTGKGLDSLPN